MGFEGGRATYVADYFSVLQKKGHISIQVTASRCPGDVCNTSGNSYLLIGEFAEVQRKISLGEFWTWDPIADARRIVDIEIHAQPNYVGGPVDILRISSRGITWIQRKAQCEN
jgi:hypothetical protein